MADELSVSAFAEALGSSAATPGGGAASALVGALAAALAEMVGRFTIGRAAYRDVEPLAEDIVRRAEISRLHLIELVAADEHAFKIVSAAYRLPKTDDDERQTRETAVQEALVVAMQPPQDTMRQAAGVVTLARDIARIGNATVLSDAACAAIIGEAAARSAAINILANVALLHDEQTGQAAMTEARTACAEALSLREETLAIVYGRMKVVGV